MEALIIDKINNEFVIEPEDYNLYFQLYNDIHFDEKVQNRLQCINQLSEGLADRVVRCQFPSSDPLEDISDYGKELY